MKEYRKEMVVLFTILFLVMAGFGIIIPIMPFFVTHLEGSPTALGFLMASYSLMQFFFAPLWGRLSDRIGRRPVLLIGLFGYGITFIIFGFSTRLWMLFAARLLSGMISSATLPTAMAYIADITGNRERAGSMGMMGAAMGLGMIFGPALGGWLGHYGFAFPFFTAGGLAIITLPFAWVFLPESLKDKSEKPPRAWHHIFGPQVFQEPQFPLFALSFVVSFTMALFESTFAIFAADRIGFGPREMGLLFTLLGILGVIMQAGLIGRLVNRFGEVKVILAGIIISAAGFLLILMADSAALMIIFAGIFSTGNSLLRPGISSLVTKTASGGQGTALGTMQSFDSLGRICGPITGGAVYDLDWHLPYSLSIVLLIAALAVFKGKLNQYSFSTDPCLDR